MNNITIKNAIRAMRRLAESILPMLFWCALIFGFDTPDVAVLTILAALIHELGHISCIIFLDGDMKLYTHASGFRIKHSSMSYQKEIMILAGGPLINIVTFLLLIPFAAGHEYLFTFASINLLTAVSNLLPIEGYDGFNILLKLLLLGEHPIGQRVLHGASFFLSVALTFFSLFLILHFGEGYWIFGIFFAITLSKIKKYLPT